MNDTNVYTQTTPTCAPTRLDRALARLEAISEGRAQLARFALEDQTASESDGTQ